MGGSRAEIPKPQGSQPVDHSTKCPFQGRKEVDGRSRCCGPFHRVRALPSARPIPVEWVAWISSEQLSFPKAHIPRAHLTSALPHRIGVGKPRNRHQEHTNVCSRTGNPAPCSFRKTPIQPLDGSSH